jgi:hypothetical protein
MEEMMDLSPKGLHQLKAAFFGEADHIDQDIRVQFANLPSESAFCLGLCTIYSDLGHRFPCIV